MSCCLYDITKCFFQLPLDSTTFRDLSSTSHLSPSPYHDSALYDVGKRSFLGPLTVPTQCFKELRDNQAEEPDNDKCRANEGLPGEEVMFDKPVTHHRCWNDQN